VAADAVDRRGGTPLVVALLESKYRVPSLRPTAVARPRLAERLSATLRSALAVLSAPAGFGKTTVLTEWLATVPADAACVAWLSLDHRDNDPVLFWTYAVTAVQTVADGVGAGALQLLTSSSPSTEAALAALLNDLNGLSKDLVLVLDDYHLIEAPKVHDGMTFLLEHQPPQLHLVLATRADPPLPLARTRARGQLVEVRAADLRFTAEESAAYLNGAMGLGLSEADVAALDGRTEGWIAALQLAALSMQGRADASAFIAGFAGDDRYIVDYLAEKSWHASPPTSETSCSPRPSSSGSPARSATPSPDGPAARRASWRSNGPTCSSSRSTIGGSGTATTTCSPTSSTRTCSRSAATIRWPSCTGEPAPGSRPPGTRRRPSATPWPGATPAEPRTSWSSPCR
jgi:hypothetical protein